MLLYYSSPASMFKKIYQLIETPLLIIGSIASILSVVLLCFNTLLTSFIAVCCLCIALGVLLYALLRAIFRYTEQTNQGGYRRIATFIEYKTVNNEIIEFQTYKVVQVKSPILKSLDVAYHWTGSQPPKVASDLQDCELITNNAEKPRGYSKLRLNLPQPKLYNETAVFHHRVTANDSDHVSQPKVEIKIDEPIDLIRVNVSLGYKPDGYSGTAKVERSAISHDAPPVYENIDLIPFDQTLKEFTYTLHYPEPGYFYRISWSR